MLVSSTAISQPGDVAPAQIHNTEIRDYISLLKPRVMSLVVFTGVCGLLLAPGTIHPFIGTLAVFCIALGSGAAGAINMWLERDRDALMKRTASRPLPAGRIHPDHALEFAIVMAFTSVFLMYFSVNAVSAGLLLLAIFYYVYVYTVWLKPRTPQNIVIGGAAGAFPPMIGWAAVTDSITLNSIILFAIIFFWTPPHFWALALYKSDDYKAAALPMLPVTHGDMHTKRQMMLYTFLLVPITLTPLWTGLSGMVYGAAASILGLLFLRHSFVVLYSEKIRPAAPRMFGFSILYLFAIFSFLVLDAWLQR